MNERPIAWACHPGELLVEELEERGLTRDAFATKVDMPLDRLSLLLDGKRALVFSDAEALSLHLGTSREFWMNLQRSYDRWMASQADDHA